MPLIPEDKLIWSPIVVNCCMNRQRKASGVNSYEQEFRFKPETYLQARIQSQGSAAWLDLCCGEGKALIQTAAYFQACGWQDKISLTGIDLLDTVPVPDSKNHCLHFHAQSVVDWQPTQTYDLITCVHGLHYLGDKLKVIETAIQALRPGGLFIANLDISNIGMEGRSVSYLKSLFTHNGLTYHTRRKILSREGPASICFGLSYLGADDTTGPNYTGQAAVTSYYAYSPS